MLNLNKLKAFRRRFAVLGDWDEYHNSFLERIRNDKKPERILDAGCGQGQIKDFFESHGAEVDYYGIDLTVGDSSWKFKVSAVADLHQIPFKDNSFDKIICTTVLEHVVNPIKVVGEFNRVLRPNGRLYLMVPMAWHLHQQPHDHFRFTKYSLEEFAKRYDLRIERLDPIGGYFYVWRYLLGLRFISDKNHYLVRLLASFFNGILKILDYLLLAPLFYFLDKLDKEKNLTVGYFVSYRKNGEQKNIDNDSNPYQCPSCAHGQFEQHTSFWKCSNCQQEFQIENLTPKLILDPSYQTAKTY